MTDLRKLEARVAEYAALIGDVRGVLANTYGLIKASSGTLPASATPPAPQARAGKGRP